MKLSLLFPAYCHLCACAIFVTMHWSESGRKKTSTAAGLSSIDLRCRFISIAGEFGPQADLQMLMAILTLIGLRF